MNKLLSVSTLIINIALIGCDSHQNPLIKNETVAWLRSDMKNSKFLGDTTIFDCGNYYVSGDKDDKLSDKCNKWSVKEFKKLQQDPSTPYQATIADFRDPQLWKIVIQKDGN